MFIFYHSRRSQLNIFSNIKDATEIAPIFLTVICRMKSELGKW